MARFRKRAGTVPAGPVEHQVTIFERLETFTRRAEAPSPTRPALRLFFQPRKPVQHEGEPERMRTRRDFHGVPPVTAQTARSPMTIKPPPMVTVRMLRDVPFSPNHSCTITRRPIAA